MNSRITTTAGKTRIPFDGEGESIVLKMAAEDKGGRFGVNSNRITDGKDVFIDAIDDEALLYLSRFLEGARKHDDRITLSGEPATVECFYYGFASHPSFTFTFTFKTAYGASGAGMKISGSAVTELTRLLKKAPLPQPRQFEAPAFGL